MNKKLISNNNQIKWSELKSIAQQKRHEKAIKFENDIRNMVSPFGVAYKLHEDYQNGKDITEELLLLHNAFANLLQNSLQAHTNESFAAPLIYP